MSKGKSIEIYSVSDWHRSMGEAEDDCDDRLESLESAVLNDEEESGWRYVGGETSAYDREHDSGLDMYRCGAERVLHFIFEDEESIQIDLQSMEFLKINDISDSPPVDMTEIILGATKRKIDKKIEVIVRIPNNTSVITARKSFKLRSVSFKNLSVVASELILGADIETVNIPTHESVVKIPYNNCGGPEQALVRETTIKVVKGWKLQTSQALTTTTKLEGSLKFSSGSASFSHEIKNELSTTREYSETKEETLRQTLNFRIAANSKVDIEIRVRSLEARRSFKGPITVDGILIASYGSGGKREHWLHDLLSLNERTFELSGFYSNIDYQEMPIDAPVSSCS